jgi:hypothetical protein
MPRAFTFVALALGAAASAAVAAAQQPRIVNGEVTAAAATSPFAASFRTLVSTQPEVAWIGYAVPAIRRDGMTMCCFSSGTTYVSGNVVLPGDGPWTSGCRIEPGDARTSTAATSGNAGAPGPVKLEGPDTLVLMFRVVERRVERIRTFSEDCELDAGGRPVRWLQHVSPADSLALLESFIPGAADRKDRVANGALSAIAMHAAAEAGAVLDRVARTHPATGVRGEALFWMAQRGEPGAERTILQAIDQDESAEVRKRGVFALSQLKDEAAVPALIRIARQHTVPAVRGEAIFWLGQKAGRKAAGEISERVEQDPDTEVKKRAVFALSQLPKDEGVPLLIRVARTNPNPAVKKQAMFWLGQSKDPRAIDFFAEILK